MEETYSADDYDYEDFESEDGDHSKSPGKRLGTPHSSKKTPLAPDVDWGADEEEGEEDEGGNDDLDVEGQDLESYMKHKSEASGNAAPQEDLACELKPLEGYRPTKENADEARLLHKLGYEHSHSNQGSPQKGVRVITNSPSPSMKSGKVNYQSFASNDIDTESSTKYGAGQGGNSDEYPSTRTSKDQKESPTSFSKQKSPRGNAAKVGFSLNDEKFVDSKNTSEDGDYDIAQEANTKVRVKVDASYIESFKAMMGSSGAGLPQKANQPSPLAASALDLLPTRKPTAEDERENAERVDALLMELFPERFEGKKGKKGKGTKKAAAAGGYSKNQVYGLAAPRGPAALPSVDYLHSSSSHALSSLQHHGSMQSSAQYSDADDAPVPLMASLDQQLKLLKKELKAKDDKITRLTEHAVMMGTHMDRLKGEAAHLTIQLREANGELEAKEARLQEALKQRKKAKKAAQQHGGGGGSGGGADVAVLENENARLREREQALMDAIEELSNQNEDLIDKLKESMERELVLSSKRAAQISQNVSALAEQAQHGANNHHLPQIGARAEAGAGPLRTQSEPIVTAAPKRAGRKKRAS